MTYIMSKTFDEARALAIKAFDKSVSELRAIVAQPGWNNDMHPPYKDAMHCLRSATMRIARLNSAEDEAK
jgi:hypothetical protein